MIETGFGELFKRALFLRKSLFSSPRTNCFRLFNASGDGLDGLTVDYYDGHVLLQYFQVEVEKNILHYVDIIAGSGESFPGLSIKSILLKNRMPLRGDRNYGELRQSKIIEGDYPAPGITVLHNGVRVGVDLINGQSTGVFMDMSQVRTDLAGYYGEGKVESVLNLFSYTGVFSVHALLNGAKGAINVDLSKGVLRRARENYMLNSLKVDERDFVYGDAAEWIKIFSKKGKIFDLIIFDPPTFARNRKKKFSVKNDFPAFLKGIGQIVSPQGYVLSSVNSHSLKQEDYLDCHPKEWEMVRFWNESSDFKYSEKPYLKVGLWKPVEG